MDDVVARRGYITCNRYGRMVDAVSEKKGKTYCNMQFLSDCWLMRRGNVWGSAELRLISVYIEGIAMLMVGIYV